MRFDSKYFRKFEFTPEQVMKNLENVFRDLKIAEKVLRVQGIFGIHRDCIKTGKENNPGGGVALHNLRLLNVIEMG